MSNNFYTCGVIVEGARPEVHTFDRIRDARRFAANKQRHGIKCRLLSREEAGAAMSRAIDAGAMVVNLYE